MESDFVPDPNLQEFVIKAAGGCVNQVRHHSGKILDYSDESVVELESFLDLMHKQMAHAKPSQSDIEETATIFGSYLGETVRRKRGGEWGTSPTGISLKLPSGLMCFPWNRVFRRLINGEEDNVHHWYVAIPQYDVKSPPPLPVTGRPPGTPPPLPK